MPPQVRTVYNASMIAARPVQAQQPNPNPNPNSNPNSNPNPNPGPNPNPDQVRAPRVPLTEAANALDPAHHHGGGL